MGCRFVARDLPRVLPGRHGEDCKGEVVTEDGQQRIEGCRGCQPCPEAHCRVCGVIHSAGACPGCLDATRETLAEIRRMCGDLPDEAETRGVDGEALVLLGPVADPEARGHLEASVAAGRVPADYLGEIVGESHPGWVLATWAMVYRDAFDHDDPVNAVQLDQEAGYLDRNLTYAATWPHVPFEDFAKELRACLTHLEVVLHDSERGERANISCFDCGGDLERKLGDEGFEDVMTCRGCKRRYTSAEYNFAVKADRIDKAEWLTDTDMQIRTGVPAATVRSWARATKDDSLPLVGKATQLGRTVYLVADVERVRDDKGLAPCA